MYGGLIVPVVVAGAAVATWTFCGMEELWGRPLSNGWFTFLLILFPFIGIRILDRLLNRLSLYFRRRDAEGNPIEPPIRHTFWLIPLPVWSYLWIALIVGLTINSWISPMTEEESQRAEELWERWREKRAAARD